MKNGLVLIDSATSMSFIPGDKIRFIHPESATNIAIYYEGDDFAAGSANITVDTGYADEVLKELARVLADTTGPFIVADDVNSIYMPNVSAVAAITINA